MDFSVRDCTFFQRKIFGCFGSFANANDEEKTKRSDKKRAQRKVRLLHNSPMSPIFVVRASANVNPVSITSEDQQLS